MVQLFDTIALDTSKVRRTRHGYLVADVLAARTGIQHYVGSEIGKPDMGAVRVYRSPDEVFNKDETMRSFTSLPITLDHPPELVTSRNWKQFARGYTGEEVARDGEFVRVPLIIQDQGAIDAVERGQRELSFGYTCDLDFITGKTPDGQDYDAVQKNLRGNHLAIVSTGRAGSHCRIGDESDGVISMPDAVLRTVTVDGIPVATTDAGAIAIDTLQKRIADHVAKNLELAKATKDNEAKATKDNEVEVARLNALIAERDKELGTLKGALETIKGEQSDPARLDAMVTERADLLNQTRAIVGDFDAKGQSVKDIRRAVVAKKLGDAEVKDRSDDYVQALFDSLAKHATTPDLVRQVMQHGSVGSTSTAVATARDAHAKMLQDTANAWKQPSSQVRN